MKNFFVSLLNSEPFVFLKGALIFLIGPLSMQLAYLMLAVGIDLFFGIQVAMASKQFKWSILFNKVKKKMMVYIGWIAMFHALDMIAGLPNTARWAVILMLAGMEIVSAIKNTSKLGYSRLAIALEQLYFSLMKSNPVLGGTQEENKDDQNGNEGGTVTDETSAEETKKTE